MSVMETAIGWLAPALCVGCGIEGTAICSSCVASIEIFGERCWRCNRLSPGSRTCDSCRYTGSPAKVFIFTDYDGLARQLLTSFKFSHQRTAAGPIAKALVRTIHQHQGKLNDYLVVPVPTAASRRRQRGFGHTELLARHVAWGLRLERSEALRRLGHTRQLGSSRQQRLHQLQDSFAVRKQSVIRDRRVLLIDDVVTTGGTIIAASKALHQAGAAGVDALLFAKRL
jgi:competence protein ComFC